MKTERVTQVSCLGLQGDSLLLLVYSPSRETNWEVLFYYGGFRANGTGTPRCLLDGDPYKPPTSVIVPSTLNPL